jgi:hypothetical protein
LKILGKVLELFLLTRSTFCRCIQSSNLRALRNVGGTALRCT